MTTLSRYDIPAPANWQDFELLCWKLWKAIWDDPNTQRNGRQGQPQAGVDVFGVKNGRHWGVQCKQSSHLSNSSFSEEDLLAEVRKATTFEPPLGGFIVATTRPRDQAIQAAARRITADHAERNLFSLHVHHWEDILALLDEHPDVYRECYPDLVLRSIERLQVAPEVVQSIAAAIGVGPPRLERGLANTSVSEVSAGEIAEIGPPRSPLDSIISTYRDLIRTAPRLAAQNLASLRSEVEHDGNIRLRFRLLTNLGAAHLEFGDTVRAAEYFLAAFPLCDGDQVGYRNRAVAYLVQNNLACANEAARDAIDHDPNDPDAYALLLQATPAANWMVEVYPQTPSQLLEQPAILALRSRQAIDQGNFSEAVRLARTGLEKRPQSQNYQAILSEALVKDVMSGSRFVVGMSVSEAVRTASRDAADEIASAWPSDPTELSPALTTIGLNRAVLLHLSGDRAVASEILEQVCRIDRNNVDAQKILALIALDRGSDLSEILPRLMMIPKGADPEVDLLSAECLFQSGDFVGAAERLNQIELGHLPPHQSISIAVLRVSLAHATGGHEAAQEVANTIREDDPGSTAEAFARAEVAKLSGSRETALEIASEIESLLGRDESLGNLLRLADLLYSIEAFYDAGRIYSSIVHTETDDLILRRYLYCLLEAKQRTLLVDTLESIPETILQGRSYRRICLAAASLTGDLDQVVEISRSYLEEWPDEFDIQIEMVSALERSGQLDAARTELSNLNPSLDESPGKLITFAHMLARNGFAQRALEIGYSTLIANRDDPQINLGYAHLVMHGSIPQDLLDADCVSVGTAVRVRSRGFTTEWIEVTSADEMSHPPSELSTSHPMVTALIGCSAGQIVQYQRNSLQQEECELLEVKSKYLHLLHRSINDFQDRFPQSRGFERIDLSHPGTDGLDLSPLLLSADRREGHVRDSLELLQAGQIPIAAFAKLVGTSVIDVSDSLADRGGGGWVSCVGTAEERRGAMEQLAVGGLSFVVDAFTLRRLRRLNIADQIHAAIASMVVTQSTVDLFLQEVLHLQTAPPSGVIARHGDSLSIIEFSAEHIEQRIRGLNADLEWMRRCCQVLPAVGARDYPDGAVDFVRTMDPSFSESILVASRPGSILLSDDLCLRRLASQLLDVKGVWIQPVMDFAVRAGQLDLPTYRRTLSEISASHVRLTYVNHFLISSSMVDAHWQAVGEVNVLAELLGRPEVDVSTAVPIASELISWIWLSRMPERCREPLTYCVLNGVKAFRNGQVLIAILERLKFPVGHPSFRVVEKWLSGHFLVH